MSDSSVAPFMPQDLLVDRPGLFIACLCAEWCGSCREYRAVFDATDASGAGTSADARAWIDVEDHAEVLGDLEIETFPTLLSGEWVWSWPASNSEACLPVAAKECVGCALRRTPGRCQNRFVTAPTQEGVAWGS